MAGPTIVTDTPGLSVGDFIAIVQDRGANQVTGMGKINAVGVGTVTVDELEDNGTAPTIDGTNDYVYELTGYSVDFGELDITSIHTSVIGFNITADVDNGYSVMVYDDGDLRDGLKVIQDVIDGAVTAASEEYGGRSSDTSIASSTFDTQDTAFTTSFQTIADETSSVFESRHFVTLKAAKTTYTVTGSYTHTLSFVVSGNF